MNFCTLFDSNYLARGLAMYESLRAHHNKFHLYVYAFDDLSFKILKSLNLPSLTVISLKEFEDEELLKIKSSRSKGEYCWTCTPSIILHSIQNFSLDHSIYVDADLYFFSDSSSIINEMEGKSILITEHRYTPRYDQTKISGVYCVQFMYFKNDSFGMKALKWWRDKCIEWCFAKPEEGKFGDQKYLDDWTSRFENVHVMKTKLGGIAPWNVQQYQFPIQSPVFYHFHGVRYNPSGEFELGPYVLPKGSIIQLYKPYMLKIQSIEKDLSSKFPEYKKARETHKPRLLSKIKRLIKNNYNYYEIDQLISKQ